MFFCNKINHPSRYTYASLQAHPPFRNGPSHPPGPTHRSPARSYPYRLLRKPPPWEGFGGFGGFFVDKNGRNKKKQIDMT